MCQLYQPSISIEVYIILFNSDNKDIAQKTVVIDTNITPATNTILCSYLAVLQWALMDFQHECMSKYSEQFATFLQTVYITECHVYA